MEGRRWPFVTFVVLLVAVHFLLRVGFGFQFWAPDLLTVALLLAARRMAAGGAAALGLLLGVLRDAVNVLSFGADGVVMTVLGYLGARTRDYFVGDSLLFLAVYLFLGKFIRDIGFALLSSALGDGQPWSNLLLTAAIAAGIASLAGLVALSAYRAVARER